MSIYLRCVHFIVHITSKGKKKLQAIINFRLMIFMLKYLGGSILLSFVYFKMYFLKDRLVEGRIDT